ncbi:MAG: helix-turn-helix transcriptional regulator [Planctomycetes bacterium]|nr:helix-turn-helix transcriptional regulator [Planctomycetota bacterium]
MAGKPGSLRVYVGGVIRQLRKAAGWTQEELGRRAGTDPKVLGEYERGVRNATLDTIERILNALGAENPSLLKVAPEAGRPERNAEEAAMLRTFRDTDRASRPLALEIARMILRWSRRRRTKRTKR